MSLEATVADIQARITAAQRERMRAEAARDAALAAAEQARTDLKRDFGVNTLAEAEDLLLTLRTELAEIVTGISTALDKVGV